jgi:hypothetical protein
VSNRAQHSTVQQSRGEDKRRGAGQKSERIKVVKHLAEVLLDVQDIGPSSGIKIRISLSGVCGGDEQSSSVLHSPELFYKVEFNAMQCSTIIAAL